jgi:hypothetical protein
MPQPPMWETHVSGQYPAAPPRPRPEDDRRPIVLPPEPRWDPQALTTGVDTPPARP